MRARDGNSILQELLSRRRCPEINVLYTCGHSHETKVSLPPVLQKKEGRLNGRSALQVLKSQCKRGGSCFLDVATVGSTQELDDESLPHFRMTVPSGPCAECLRLERPGEQVGRREFLRCGGVYVELPVDDPNQMDDTAIRVSARQLLKWVQLSPQGSPLRVVPASARNEQFGADIAYGSWERVREATGWSPAILAALLWAVGSAAWALYHASSEGLAVNSELLKEQLQRRIADIPLPPESPQYQQYKHYYLRQYQLHLEESGAAQAQWQHHWPAFNWHAFQRMLGAGVFIFAAAIAYCEYHYGALSYWMDVAEDSWYACCEWWSKRSDPLGDSKRMESFLKEMGEEHQVVASTPSPSSQSDRKRTCKAEGIVLSSKPSTAADSKCDDDDSVSTASPSVSEAEVGDPHLRQPHVLRSGEAVATSKTKAGEAPRFLQDPADDEPPPQTGPGGMPIPPEEPAELSLPRLPPKQGFVPKKVKAEEGHTELPVPRRQCRAPCGEQTRTATATATATATPAVQGAGTGGAPSRAAPRAARSRPSVGGKGGQSTAQAAAAASMPVALVKTEEPRKTKVAASSVSGPPQLSGRELMRQAEELLSQLNAEELLRQLEVEENKKRKKKLRRKGSNLEKGVPGIGDGAAGADNAPVAAADSPPSATADGEEILEAKSQDEACKSRTSAVVVASREAEEDTTVASEGSGCDELGGHSGTSDGMPDASSGYGDEEQEEGAESEEKGSTKDMEEEPSHNIEDDNGEEEHDEASEDSSANEDERAQQAATPELCTGKLHQLPATRMPTTLGVWTTKVPKRGLKNVRIKMPIPLTSPTPVNMTCRTPSAPSMQPRPAVSNPHSSRPAAARRSPPPPLPPAVWSTPTVTPKVVRWSNSNQKAEASNGCSVWDTPALPSPGSASTAALSTPSPLPARGGSGGSGLAAAERQVADGGEPGTAYLEKLGCESSLDAVRASSSSFSFNPEANEFTPVFAAPVPEREFIPSRFSHAPLPELPVFAAAAPEIRLATCSDRGFQDILDKALQSCLSEKIHNKLDWSSGDGGSLLSEALGHEDHTLPPFAEIDMSDTPILPELMEMGFEASMLPLLSSPMMGETHFMPDPRMLMYFGMLSSESAMALEGE